MKSNCADPGTIQAFIDGELPTGEMDALTSHFATCSDCAVALADAEEQAEMVFAAMGREYDQMVPTQRLWTKINHAIESERSEISLWTRVRSFLAFPLANPSLSAAMALLLVFGLSAVLLIDRDPDVSSPVIADQNVSKSVETARPMDISEINESPATVVSLPQTPRTGDVNTGGFRIERADHRQPAVPKMAAQTRTGVVTAASEFTISGEETYIKTISDLSRSVGGSAGDLMRPNEMIAFERNMAIVDDSISRLRKEIRRDPKNDAAKQMLRSSYQNKIDLLNSIAQREELVASLR